MTPMTIKIMLERSAGELWHLPTSHIHLPALKRSVHLFFGHEHMIVQSKCALPNGAEEALQFDKRRCQ